MLIDWINDVLVGERIIVKDLAEDLYDGQVLQKLFGETMSEHSWWGWGGGCSVCGALALWHTHEPSKLVRVDSPSLQGSRRVSEWHSEQHQLSLIVARA